MPSRVRTFRLPPELDARVEKYLNDSGKSFTEWLRELIEDDLFVEQALAQSPTWPLDPRRP